MTMNPFEQSTQQLLRFLTSHAEWEVIDYSGAKYTRFPPKIAAMQKSLFRVVENSKFLNRLRNGHLEKSAVMGTKGVSYSPLTAVSLFNRAKRLRS